MQIGSYPENVCVQMPDHVLEVLREDYAKAFNVPSTESTATPQDAQPASADLPAMPELSPANTPAQLPQASRGNGISSSATHAPASRNAHDPEPSNALPKSSFALPPIPEQVSLDPIAPLKNTELPQMSGPAIWHYNAAEKIKTALVHLARPSNLQVTSAADASKASSREKAEAEAKISSSNANEPSKIGAAAVRKHSSATTTRAVLRPLDNVHLKANSAPASAQQPCPGKENSLAHGVAHQALQLVSPPSAVSAASSCATASTCCFPTNPSLSMEPAFPALPGILNHAVILNTCNSVPPAELAQLHSSNSGAADSHLSPACPRSTMAVQFAFVKDPLHILRCEQKVRCHIAGPAPGHAPAAGMQRQVRSWAFSQV